MSLKRLDGINGASKRNNLSYFLMYFHSHQSCHRKKHGVKDMGPLLVVWKDRSVAQWSSFTLLDLTSSPSSKFLAGQPCTPEFHVSLTQQHIYCLAGLGVKCMGLQG